VWQHSSVVNALDSTLIAPYNISSSASLALYGELCHIASHTVIFKSISIHLTSDL